MTATKIAKEIYEALKEPFDPKVIHWRVGSVSREKNRCMPLAYIDARDAMKRLDDVMGIDGWQCNYTLGNNGMVVCNLGLLLPREDKGYEWVWKADGAGETKVEGDKGSLSDAFKRAAVRFGIGRYLYYLPNTWVDYDGKTFTPPQMPHWAYPTVKEDD